MNKTLNLHESVLDNPKSSLDSAVWQKTLDEGKPELTEEALRKLENAIEWVQDQYHFSNLSVYIIGSICSNSWSQDSDIDIDFCAHGATEDDNDEDVVKEFGWAFKKNFIENYIEKFPEEAKIGTHLFEVYFNPNPFQCFMSIGCYNVLEKKWEVGPELKKEGFDPISEYYADAMKQVDKILKDIRLAIFEIYELSLVTKKSSNQRFKDETFKTIFEKLERISKLFKTMKRVRSNFQKPCKSKEEALKRRKDRKQHVVDAAFKFLEKFGYIQIMKDMIRLYDDKMVGAKLSQSYIVDQILASVKANMSLKHLQDSEDQQFIQKLLEADQLLDEGIGNAINRFSLIASLMAIPNILPANSLAKELDDAKKAGQEMTINSIATKNAIANASKDNKMLGPMSKTNVVNAIAQTLWKEARGEGIDGRNAVASVILNRTGNDPTCIVDVLKQPSAFSCYNGYSPNEWTDRTYRWFLPYKQISSNKADKAIWNECNDIAVKLVEKRFKSTIGNKNTYLNKQTADKANVEGWGKKCTLKVGNHYFGYLPEHDPKYVKPGTMTSWKKINSQKPMVVTVKSGDTLGKIARDNKTTVGKILSLNSEIKDPNKISIGQKIKIA